MNSKDTQLMNMLINEDIDIMKVSETDLIFDEKKPFSLEGFKTFYPLLRQERNVKRMLLFVRNDIEVEERRDLMSPDISTVWLEYKPHKGKKFLICQKYIEFLQKLMEFSQKPKEFSQKVKSVR